MSFAIIILAACCAFLAVTVCIQALIIRQQNERNMDVTEENWGLEEHNAHLKEEVWSLKKRLYSPTPAILWKERLTDV